MLVPFPAQLDIKAQIIPVLKTYGLCYVACEERTGKTLATILAIEELKVERVLVLTKKKAEQGWLDTLSNYPVTKKYVVMRYTSLHNYVPADYDLIVLDEAHNYISAFPKTGKAWKQLKPICAGKPIIYISATPYAQGIQMLYHQLALSDFSPWAQYKDFYKWFYVYGKAYTIEVNGIPRTQYTRVKDLEQLEQMVRHLFVTKTREEAGFEHEPIDKLHYIELDSNVKEVYNILVKDEIIELSVGTLVADSVSKLRTSLHQLEGGTIKINDDYFVLANREKIDFILREFGDSNDVVIMYNFKAELTKLQAVFKNATLLQATSYAEGVDLKDFKHLIIYSQDYSTARHTQRRARQCNINRTEPITVHYLLAKKGISEQVYNTVSRNKRNFVDSVFRRSLL